MLSKYVLFLAAATGFSFLPTAWAAEPIRIDVGSNYQGYTNDELRRRVWTLERAVAQLQDQVFQLAMRNGSAQAVAPAAIWTCQMQSFGKMQISSSSTRAAALALVLKKCSDATNAIHCHENDVKCDNQ